MTCQACLRRAISARATFGSSQAQQTRSLSHAFTSSTLLGNTPGPSRPTRSALGCPASHRPTTSRAYNTHRVSYRTHSNRSAVLSEISYVSRRSAATQRKVVEETRLSAPQHPLKVTPPALEAIREEGYLDDDVELLPAEEAWINISPEAISQLVRITSKEPPELLAQNKLALRVGVESGGCHGYQYIMEIVEERRTDDYVLQPEGVDCIPVVVELISLKLLKGATLHHATELIGSSFRLQDNPQAKEGGNCGCGVSWELK